MKRLLVVGMVTLAFAGCAQSRSAISKRDGKPPDPVALTTVPPLHETVNRGMGGPAVARTAIKNPNDPMWTARDQVTTVARPAADGPIKPGVDPYEPTSAASASGPAGPIAGQAPQPLDPLARPTGVRDAGVAPSALGVSAPTPSTGLSRAPKQPAADSLEAMAGLVPSPTGMPAPAPVTGRAPSPILPTRATSPGLTTSGANAASMTKPQTSTAPQSFPGANPVLSPSASRQPMKPSSAGSTEPPARRGDPLLGPEPDLMPDMSPLPSEKPPAGHVADPAEAPIELTPAPSSPEQPVPGAAAGPEPTGPLSSLAPSDVANKPATAGKLAAAGPVGPAPVLDRTSVAAAAAPAPASAAQRIPVRKDEQVVKTSATAPLPDEPLARNLGKEAGRPIARVGDEIITFHDLVVATQERLSQQPGLRENIFSVNPVERNKQLDLLAKYTLEALIERSLLVQEAKHAIKDSKQLDKMMDMADKVWREDQLPPLERQFSVETEQQLKEKFSKGGRSLDQMRETFRQDFLAQGYLQDRLKDKLKIELPTVLKYYSDHLHDPEFQRPAQITWRELVVEIDKYPSPEAAREKAFKLLERLRRGEDFATLARNESDGPSSSRKDGGLMQTSPGGYAVPAVNQALSSLPIGNVSGILEGPTSLHIVRVDSRRPAGPAEFEELHPKIRAMLFEERARVERAAFMSKLRQRTLIAISLDEIPTKSQPPLTAKADH